MRIGASVWFVVSVIGCTATPSPAGCETASDCDGGVCSMGVCTVPEPDAGRDASCAGGGCECTRDEECSSPHPCIDALCLDGACVRRAYDARCPSGEYCDSRVGCTAMPDGGMPDAPPFDAPGLDAPDARTTLRDTNLQPVGGACIFDRECGPVGSMPPACIDAPNEIGQPTAAPRDGYCSARCEPFLPDACGLGATCVMTETLSGSGWCFATCGATPDCRAGQTCADPPFGSGARRVCLPSEWVSG